MPLLHQSLCGAPGGKTVGPRAGKRVAESATSPYGTIFHANRDGGSELQNYLSKSRPMERSIFEWSTGPQVNGSHILVQWTLTFLSPSLPSAKSCERKENGGWGKLSWPCWSGRQTSQLPFSPIISSVSLSLSLSRSSPRLGRNIQRPHWSSQYRTSNPVTFFVKHPPRYVSIAKCLLDILLSTDPVTSSSRLLAQEAADNNQCVPDECPTMKPPLDGGREESPRYLNSEAITPNGLFAFWLISCVIFSAD